MKKVTKRNLLYCLASTILFGTAGVNLAQDQDRERAHDRDQDRTMQQDHAMDKEKAMGQSQTMNPDRAMDRSRTQDRLHDGTPIYGSQLMTDQERTKYRNRVEAAATEQERAAIKQQHQNEMQDRARQQGVTLPEEE